WLPAPNFADSGLTSHFEVARPVASVTGLRRSGWRRSADHDRRSLRKLGQNQVSQRKPSSATRLGGPRRSLTGPKHIPVQARI
ncbi:MAG: hypothetical protein LC775_07620, partial [Acidobacteria bacterium]|nr:hypothetical protein [Acidobacteriota bacterium]